MSATGSLLGQRGTAAAPAHAQLGIGALLLMVGRSLRQHAVSTWVTVLAVALATGLVMAVFAIQQQTRAAFVTNVGFDAVLGAPGSKLQLVLNAVYHLETSPGNLPWRMYEEIKRRPDVKLAVPYALGDNYYGFRVVGTTPELFREFEYAPGEKYRFAAGRAFDPQYAEAVVGSFAAQRTGLKVGDTFKPFHGLAFNEAEQHDVQYTVVGVLAPTNTPSDRAIWIPIEGVFRMPGHALRGSGGQYVAEAGAEIPDEHKEVSAVLLKLRGPQAGAMLDQLINKQGKVATLAWPIGVVMADLFDKIGWMSRVLELVAYLVVAVSAGAILAGIYNTINERRREFAILRALGARRASVFSAIMLETAAIAGIGALLGFVIYAAIVAAAAAVIREQTGVVLAVWAYHPVLWLAPLGMLLAGAVVGIIPAIKAYSTEVASHLSPVS